jgi:hypothetical protein
MDQLWPPSCGSVSEPVGMCGWLAPQTVFSFSAGSASERSGLPRVRVTRGEV